MKKILAFVLTAMLTLGLFAGCDAVGEIAGNVADAAKAELEKQIQTTLEKHKVNVIELGTAVGKGQEAVNGQAGSGADLHARVSRGTQGVLGQHAAVGVAKLDHQFFSIIMCDQGDIHSSFSFSHFFIKG